MIPRDGPPEVLEVEDRPDPQPGPGEVRVRVKAAGINFADLMARQGMYPDAPKLPAVVGYEFAGDVESLGRRRRRLRGRPARARRLRASAATPSWS